MQSATRSGPSPSEILTALREQVPELEHEDRWPGTIVFDAFADHVSDRVRAAAPAEELERYFGYVEELAATGDVDAENLVIVDFLEAAPWGWLGAAALLGPATMRLAPRADNDLLGDAG